ncbi:MAG: hypothetical protein WCP21_13980, partial [Armatimonadota bacterium]
PDTAHWAAEQIARTQDEAFVTEALLLRSEVAIRRGGLTVAVDQARQALVADPQSGRAHEQLGRALLLQGKWDAAVGQMIEALHTGHAGSLAAGVAALGALDDGDLAAARGLFLAERYGDGLACAVSHAAQARLLQAEGEVASALDRATSAIEELRELPAWAASPEVVARLATALRGVLTEAGGAEEESVRADAERGLGALEEMKHTTLLRRGSARA